MSVTAPKYSRIEFERRWLVENRRAGTLAAAPASRILDRYLDGTRLRLRRLEAVDGTITLKLCKKYGDAPAGRESITNLYLSPAEYGLLARLPGWQVAKRRHRLAAFAGIEDCGSGSLDHYQGAGDALWLFEREFADAAAAEACRAPPFCEREITGEADYSGAALARRFGAHET